MPKSADSNGQHCISWPENPNITEATIGSTALHSASVNDHAQVAGVLLKFGADPSIKTRNKGATAFHMAAEKNHAEAVPKTTHKTSTQHCTWQVFTDMLILSGVCLMLKLFQTF